MRLHGELRAIPFEALRSPVLRVLVLDALGRVEGYPRPGDADAVEAWFVRVEDGREAEILWLPTRRCAVLSAGNDEHIVHVGTSLRKDVGRYLGAELHGDTGDDPNELTRPRPPASGPGSGP